MTTARRFLFLALILILEVLTTSCTAVLEHLTTDPEQPPKPRVEAISVILRHKNKVPIPPKTRIVVARVFGDCAEEVENAVVRRLVENSDYTILTRDNLDLIIGESDRNYLDGSFDTETVSKLGKLLGATAYIVGRVHYCGRGVRDVLIDDDSYWREDNAGVGARGYNSSDADFEPFFEISAALQVISVETGEVILSSAADGVHFPRVPQSLLLYEPHNKGENNSGEDNSKGDGSKKGSNVSGGLFGDHSLGDTSKRRRRRPAWHFLNITTGGIYGSLTEAFGGDKEDSSEDFRLSIEPPDYLVVKTAESLAADFADRFFARPTWEKVEMWRTRPQELAQSANLVRLGQCHHAVKLLESGDVRNLIPRMSAQTLARYLHNYGVALLCANESEAAVEKLNSAYRIEYNASTLKMVDLAERVVEWSLEVEVDRGAEINTLLQRYIPENQALLASSRSSGSFPTRPPSGDNFRGDARQDSALESNARIFSDRAEKSRKLDKWRPTDPRSPARRSNGEAGRKAVTPIHEGVSRQGSVPSSSFISTQPTPAPRQEATPLQQPPVPPPSAKPPTPFNRIANISWSSGLNGGIVEIETNGLISPDSYNHVHIDGEDPRELIRLFGVAQPYELREIRLRSKVIDGIRVGYHNNSELHVVLDMLDHKSRITRTWIEGTTLRVLVE